MKKAGILAALCAAVLAGAGCAPPFPKELLHQVDASVTFTDLQKNTEQYQGKLVMLGGMIVETKNTKEGTLIEVLQKPLEGDGKPRQTDESGGRFLVTTGKFLDAAVYHGGRLVTIIGEVSGRKTLKLGEIEYQYPVIRARDQHLWQPSYGGPRFFFGVGVTRHL